MATSTAQKATASMLDNAQFSDIALRCEGKFINAHRVIICPRSSKFSEICKEIEDGKEEREPLIDIDGHDLDTVYRMLSHIYTNDYDDGSQLHIGPEHKEDDNESGSSDEKDEAEDDDASVQIIGQRQPSVELGQDPTPPPEAVDKSDPIEHVIHTGDFTPACTRMPRIKEEPAEGSKIPAYKRNTISILISRTNKALINNCRVMRIAQQYGIEDLKSAAFEKFIALSRYEDEHRGWTTAGFIHVLNEVYSSATSEADNNLWKRVATMTADKRTELWQIPSFVGRALRVPDFMRLFTERILNRADNRESELQDTIKRLRAKKKDLEGEVKSLRKRRTSGDAAAPASPKKKKSR